jgi:hypothetical protein
MFFHFIREIEEGEVVVAWTGRIVTYKEMLALPEDERDYYFQIDDDLFQVPFVHGEREPAVHFSLFSRMSVCVCVIHSQNSL